MQTRHALIKSILNFSTTDGDWRYKTCPFAPLAKLSCAVEQRGCGIACALFEFVPAGAIGHI